MQSNSVYKSVPKIPIVHADSLSKLICQNFSRKWPLFVLERILYFATIMETNRDSARQSQNEDNSATFSLGLEFSNVAEKEKNNGKDSASVPSRFPSLNNHFWYCCLFFASDMMHNSTSYVIKQLVHAFNCALLSYGPLGKYGEHSRS